jgi:hypothetical protein
MTPLLALLLPFLFPCLLLALITEETALDVSLAILGHGEAVSEAISQYNDLQKSIAAIKLASIVDIREHDGDSDSDDHSDDNDDDEIEVELWQDRLKKCFRGLVGGMEEEEVKEISDASTSQALEALATRKETEAAQLIPALLPTLHLIKSSLNPATTAPITMSIATKTLVRLVPLFEALEELHENVADNAKRLKSTKEKKRAGAVVKEAEYKREAVRLLSKIDDLLV